MNTNFIQELNVLLKKHGVCLTTAGEPIEVLPASKADYPCFHSTLTDHNELRWVVR